MIKLLLSLSLLASINSFSQDAIQKFLFNSALSNTTGSISFSDPITGNGPVIIPYVQGRNTEAQTALRILNTTRYVASNATIPNIPQGNSPRTISIWLQSIEAGVKNVFVYGSDPINTTGGFGLKYNSSGSQIIVFGFGSDMIAPIGLPTNTWHHLVVTYDATNSLKLYLNNTLIANNTLASINTLGTLFTIGQNVRHYYDDLQIFDRAITATEVDLLYTTNSILASENFTSNALKATIYPNPASDKFTIEIENEVKSVEIYSLQGQKVVTSTDKNINVSNLSKGMYLVRIEDSTNAVSTQKLLVK
jgi:Secretion system C-terminal sorting domain/Concanavalin A-like lectin/glucanases superfamily